MRLLIDPHDAAAVVRALARPPIELRQVHLALVIQLARRRKLDLIAGLSAANESPQVPPEARERIQRFVELHRRAAAAFEALAPDEFTASLIETLRTRGRALLAPAEAGRQRASLERLRQVVVDFARRRPGSTPRELAAHLLALASEGRWTEPRAEARSARGEPAAGEQPPPADDHAGERREGAPPPPAQARAQAEDQLASQLEASLQVMREELLESVSRIGGRLGELRLDSELDIAHGVVRYLELLKL